MDNKIKRFIYKYIINEKTESSHPTMSFGNIPFRQTALYALTSTIDGPQYPIIVDTFPSIIDANYAKRILTDNRPYLQGYIHTERIF